MAQVIKRRKKGNIAEIVVITDSVEERHLKDSLAVFQGMSIVKQISAIICVAFGSMVVLRTFRYFSMKPASW